MIFKNNVIKQILEPITNGIVKDKIMQWFSWAKIVIETVHQLYIALDSTYQMVLKLLENPILTIPPESYVWALTPRSTITCPGQLYVEIPESKLLTDIFPGGSPLQVIDINKINNIIKGLFPPIMPVEYIMPPDIFKYRLALSDQSDMVKIVAEYLEKFLKIGPEYMPKYEELTPINPFFIVAILVGWGPKA